LLVTALLGLLLRLAVMACCNSLLDRLTMAKFQRPQFSIHKVFNTKSSNAKTFNTTTSTTKALRRKTTRI
ncbi:29149_t:CDS:1, partial [Gigaspora margarita]